MSTTAKVFMLGRNQAVRLPKEFRVSTKDLFIRQDEVSGDIILSQRPHSWNGLFELDKLEKSPIDFMNNNDRNLALHNRDPFNGYAE